jgi:hypothetical protein
VRGRTTVTAGGGVLRRCDGVILEGEDIALAAVLVWRGVEYLQRRDATVPARALQLRDELAAFAARESAAAVVSVPGEPGNLAATVVVAESFPQQMTVQAAAGLLGISPQAVRGLCRSGALLATRSPAGGHWQIDMASTAALAARRKGLSGEREDFGILRVVRARH